MMDYIQPPMDDSIDETEQPVKKSLITYSEYEIMMDEMVQKLCNIKFAAIHGLPRGGLPIAVHLSHYLELPLLINIQRFKQDYPNETLLVVDDIIDTGKTFERFLEIAKIQKFNYKIATLFYKPHAKYEPDIFIKQTLDWIVFPWEQTEEMPNREQYESLGGSRNTFNFGVGDGEE